jgi:hypothetical protein
MARFAASAPRSLCAAAAALACMVLGGCETIALSAIGASASAGLSYTMNGAAYRTFTASEARVRAAAFTALKRMASPIESTEKTDAGSGTSRCTSSPSARTRRACARSPSAAPSCTTPRLPPKSSPRPSGRCS